MPNIKRLFGFIFPLFTWCNTLVRAFTWYIIKKLAGTKNQTGDVFSAFFSIVKGKLLTDILPVMAPLALMMAKYAVDCVKTRNLTAIKFNGFTNIAFAILAIITLIIMGLFVEHPLYTPLEWPKLALGITVFAFG